MMGNKFAGFDYLLFLDTKLLVAKVHMTFY